MVIGGGIHGISVALALASRGRRSLLLEAQPDAFSRASLRNEGKVHLGFVYALDPSGATTAAMVEGALAFTPLIERWCAGIEWGSVRSGRFAYVIMDDGLAGPDQLEGHYERVLAEIERAGGEIGFDYLGVDLADASVTRHDEIVPGMVDGHSSCWFETPERAVDPRGLRGAMVEAALSSPLIELRTGHRVVAAERTENGFGLEVRGASGETRLETASVVNCAWEGRPLLDRMILEDPGNETFRIKHRVVVDGAGGEGIPPVTMVQGPFGDVVPWPAQDTYISWYPEARTHFGNRPEDGLDPDRSVARRVHAEIGRLFPDLRGCTVSDFGPCHILAEGRTDIDDPASGLHSRIGAAHTGTDGWWSIRSTKLTTAPLAAERCAAEIAGTGIRL